VSPPNGSRRSDASIKPGTTISSLFCIRCKIKSPIQTEAFKTNYINILRHFLYFIPDSSVAGEGCEYCVRAKGLLNDAGIEFEELLLNRDYNEATIRAISGEATVPQVFINGERIGGSENLEQFLKRPRIASAVMQLPG
jgi:glutaredoxin